MVDPAPILDSSGRHAAVGRLGRGLLAVALVTALSACASPGRPTRACAAAIEEQVLELLDTLAADLEAEGPLAWPRHCAASFAMASDGAQVFADHAGLVAFVTGFDSQVASMNLSWAAPRVTPLGPGLAHFGAAYDETIVLTDGSEDRFGGYVTGLAARHDGRWRFERLHWSSPAAGGDDS